MPKDLQFDMEQATGCEISVIGVGGGGGNAVNHMYKDGITGVDFVVCNTDAQALESSPVPLKIQIGGNITEGRGAGSDPEVGRKAALENIEQIKSTIQTNTKMLFITAGMGGGTGTGAAPVIAEAARELGILTVGIVTMPFEFEGMKRREYAQTGIQTLKEHVDTLVIISNDTLRKLYGNLAMGKAFQQADNILTTAAKGIAEIITVTGYVNVDFEDVRTVMRDSGVAIMGSATCEGEDRARRAIEEALHSPILNDNDIRGAKHILLNITSGEEEVLMDELTEITDYVQEEAGQNANLIWGHCQTEEPGNKLSVTLIATGFEGNGMPPAEAEPKRKYHKLNTSPGTTASQPSHPGSTAPAGGHTVKPPRGRGPKGAHAPVNPPYPGGKHNPSDTPRPVSEWNPSYNEEGDPNSTKPHKLKRRREGVPFSSDNLDEVERTPAFVRRQIPLAEIPHSSDEQVSRYTLGESRNGEHSGRLRSNNRYLHDNVD